MCAGFDYLTEAGAVAAQVEFSVPQELSALLDQQDCSSSSSEMAAGHEEDGRRWITTLDYANGGPVLLAADGNPDLRQLPSVTVLARYGQLHQPSAAPGPAQPAHQQQRQRQDATGRVAAVRCAVGKGVAVLCGTHPELGPEWLDPCGESNAAHGPQPPEAPTSSPSAQAAAAGASIPQQQREQGQQVGSRLQVVVEEAVGSSLCSSGEGQTVVCRDVALAAHAQQLQAQLRASQAGRDLLLCSLLYHALASHLRA